ncbi:uncharacterized protein BDZ83DRAFT_645130 [Colletotrichum acutatum]|uniref:Uncharacterized protein n=1 Tax=Glomerella acutata TaxID=27357 RepID=A0AAD8U8K3_GLOAC|nr:uncharacterized protein BDZ83DRAFT_645130 [Colletotrichum acutatum]KAK1702949.1 hypothetical protein BDZ83DRAFT_645130 [Colletotrichum acutatum]
MPETDRAVVTEALGAAGGSSRSRNVATKRGTGRLTQPATRKPTATITKKRQSKKTPPRGSVRHFPCRQCVTRATKAPGHECASQDNTGAACWDCAKTGHTCRPVPAEAHAAVRAFWALNQQLSNGDGDPDEVWRSAGQRALQQLRACGNIGVSPPMPLPVASLASFGETTEKSLEERKTMALETIALAARLWVVSLNRSEMQMRTLTR